MENKELMKNFYRNCKKIEVDNLRLDDCRITAIVKGMPNNSAIPLASAKYTETESIKGCSTSLDSIYRIAYVLYKEFNRVICPAEKKDMSGTHIVYIVRDKIESDSLDSPEFFQGNILKGDIKRPSSAKSATASTSASKSATASTSTTASKPATASTSASKSATASTSASKSVSDAKEEKTILIVEKLSDIIKNRLKVSASQLAEIETAFMEVLSDNL